jgi:mannose-1-phosphate guanylyltransferase
MAGGIGSRFWPYSRTKKPKQFLDILGTGQSLLQQTIERYRNICPIENILIVSNEEYGPLILEQVPDIHANRFCWSLSGAIRLPVLPMPIKGLSCSIQMQTLS